MGEIKTILEMAKENHDAPLVAIRRAQDRDADCILSLYQSVIGTPFCTWDEDYPNQEEIEEDLLHDSLFLLEKEEQCIGALSVAWEPEFADQPYWRITENAKELARLVISTDYRGKGYAAYMMTEIARMLKADGCRATHLAVAAHHLPAQKVYFGLGYEKVGEADLFGHHFYLCEKEL